MCATLPLPADVADCTSPVLVCKAEHRLRLYRRCWPLRPDTSEPVLASAQASASEAGSQLPSSAKGYLGYVLANRSAAQILPLIENAVECRTQIKEAMTGNRRAPDSDCSA